MRDRSTRHQVPTQSNLSIQPLAGIISGPARPPNSTLQKLRILSPFRPSLSTLLGMRRKQVVPNTAAEPYVDTLI
jgi:hypothetical protein